MEETREETPQDLRNLALKVAGLLEEAGQHALHDQLNPRNLAQPSTEADRGPRYKLEVDSKILRFMSSRIADIAHFDGFWTTRPAESRPPALLVHRQNRRCDQLRTPYERMDSDRRPVRIRPGQ